MRVKRAGDSISLHFNSLALALAFRNSYTGEDDFFVVNYITKVYQIPRDENSIKIDSAASAIFSLFSICVYSASQWMLWIRSAGAEKADKSLSFM